MTCTRAIRKKNEWISSRKWHQSGAIKLTSSSNLDSSKSHILSCTHSSSFFQWDGQLLWTAQFAENVSKFFARSWSLQQQATLDCQAALCLWFIRCVYDIYSLHSICITPTDARQAVCLDLRTDRSSRCISSCLYGVRYWWVLNIMIGDWVNVSIPRMLWP